MKKVKKKYRDMSIEEKVDWKNKMALRISLVSLFLLFIAYLDKIVSFAHCVLSSLR